METLRFLAAVALALSPVATAAAAAASSVPKEQLLKPPANAEHFVVVSDAGKHGDQWRWTLPDGRIAYRDSQALRVWISEVDQVVALGPDGIPMKIKVRGSTPRGDAAETFELAGDKATWKSASDSGSFEGRRGFYVPAGGIWLANELLVKAVVAAGPIGLDLLPAGRATMTIGGSVTVNGRAGPKTVKLAFIRGILASPIPIWLDEHNNYFAEVGWPSVIAAGYEVNERALRVAQEAATDAEVKAIANRFLAPQAKAPVLFDNVRLFDADKGVFIANQAVLVRDGKVAAIGAAGSITPPSSIRTIDGRGKTLVPGLWDAHFHIGDDWDGLANVAAGMTSLRSPGTLMDRAESTLKRRASGDLLIGEPFISVLVDRKDPRAAQGALTVESEAETIAAVRTIKDAALWGVKFYSSMNPSWIAPGAAEARRLGLHVHGHVPATMRPLEAIRAGYDELTHLYFVVMQAMPKEVVDKSNTTERLDGPARLAKDVDLSSPGMRAFIAELAQRGTIIDPTLALFESFFAADGGSLAPAYSAYAEIIPPAIVRTLKTLGRPLAKGYTQGDYRKSFAKMVDLVSALHRAGVPIVAGTDRWGIELVRELELYQQAGMAPGEALQTATIVPARVVGADKRTGSIAVGKEADLVLVDGDVSKDLGALRRTLVVVSDGFVMDADELRKAAGYIGRPK